MKKVLCIGGPYDGRLVAVEDNSGRPPQLVVATAPPITFWGPIMPDGTPVPPPVSFDSVCYHKWPLIPPAMTNIEVWKPDGQTSVETVSLLILAYLSVHGGKQ